MAVLGSQWGSLAALVGGNRFRWADLVPDPEFIDLLIKAELKFWLCLQNQVPPPADAHQATRAVLKKLYPKDLGETVALPPEALGWLDQWEKAKADRKAAEKVENEAENKLIAAMGAASLGVLPNDEKVSFKEQTRAGYTCGPASFRVLRHVGSKKK